MLADRLHITIRPNALYCVRQRGIYGSRAMHIAVVGNLVVHHAHWNRAVGNESVLTIITNIRIYLFLNCSQQFSNFKP